MPVINQLKKHKVLLDTHVWIWIMTGNSLLTSGFRRGFERILQEDGVFLSPISVWEVGMLVEKKRISIDMDVQEWVDQSLNIPGLKIAPITPRIAIASTRLPGVIHADPADRILIATAHEESFVFVTCDENILQYGTDKFLTVMNPSR